MHFRDVQVGEPVDVHPGRAMQAEPPLPSPRWFALVTPPQRERAARSYLKAAGIDAFYPSEEVRTMRRGKRYTRERPIVGGYVFARFTLSPQWDVIRARPFFSGVVAVGLEPYSVPVDTIRRLRGLAADVQREARERAEAIEAARLEMMPRAGERAHIIEGPLAGFLVDVTSIKGRMARILLPGGAKALADTSSMVREGVDLATVPGYISVASP